MSADSTETNLREPEDVFSREFRDSFEFEMLVDNGLDGQLREWAASYDEKMLSSTDWDRLKVTIKQIRTSKLQDPLSLYKCKIRYIEYTEQSIQDGAFRYVEEALERINSSDEKESFLEETFLELKLLNEDAPVDLVRPVLNKVEILYNHHSDRRPTHSSPVSSETKKRNHDPNGNRSIESFEFRGAKAELRYLLNEIYERWIDDIHSKAEFFRALAPLFECHRDRISESDVENMLKKVNTPPSKAMEIDEMLDEAEDKRFDDL